MVSHPSSRQSLSGIPAYRAGLPAPTGSAKLSSNENPFPPLPGVEAAIADAAAAVNRYPDFGNARLLTALSGRLGVDEDQISVGTGSVAVLVQVMTAMAEGGDEVVMPWRSFEAYPIVVQLSGATQVRVPLASDHTHDLEAMAAAVNKHTKVVLVCTPNNPTGTVVRRRELAEFIDRVPSDVLIVVDEAYVEFVYDAENTSALDLVSSRDNVLVLRTFSKAFGLANLRVGYGVGPRAIVQELRKTQLPFGVSTVAESAALAALAGERELQRRVGVVTRERDRVLDELRAHAIEVPESQGNFVWLPLGQSAVEFAERCEDAGVVVRTFPGDGVRVTVGERAANDRWLAVLRGQLRH
jgi:histidinol-phosphate aminotransferase